MPKHQRLELTALAVPGQWMRWLMYRYGYSRPDIAELLGVGVAAVTSYSRPNGDLRRRDPDDKTRGRICGAAGIGEREYFAGPPK